MEFAIPSFGTPPQGTLPVLTAICGSAKAKCNNIAQITTGGMVSEFAVPTASS